MRPWTVMGVGAALLLAGYLWQQYAAKAQAQRLAARDAHCAAQAATPPAATPPAAFKRSLPCVGWSLLDSDSPLPPRG